MDANLLKPTKKTRRKKALKSYVTSKGNNIREERKEKEKKSDFLNSQFLYWLLWWSLLADQIVVRRYEIYNI